MKRFRIVKKPNTGSYQNRYPYRYFVQKERSVFGLTWWSEVDWCFSLDGATLLLDQLVSEKIRVKEGDEVVLVREVE